MLSYLPAQYWNFADARSSTTDTAMTAAVPNPFYAALASMQASNPTLYNYVSTVSWFTSKTVQVQQLLRAYPNAGGALQEADGFTAKSVYNDGRTAISGSASRRASSPRWRTPARPSRQQWQANQFDPALEWELNPNTRPNRLVWTTVWELPFGRGRQWLTHGPLQHVVGGWQLSWIYSVSDRAAGQLGEPVLLRQRGPGGGGAQSRPGAFAELPPVVQSERGVQQRDQPGRFGHGSHSFRIRRI
jgi:hypothetical protein